MQPRDTQPPAPQSEQARPTDYDEDLTRTESHAVSTEFDPQTARRLKKAGIVFVGVLVFLFIAVRIDRFFEDRRVARAASHAVTAPQPVDVVEAKPVGSVERFSLPGQTAAWHASTIYARVNGYVAQWFVDIGDRVHKGQVLALIETPELDAQLAAARAQLRAAQAQVAVRQAEAEFSKSTYERWRDSPKGVVSEQEREEKRADYDSAVARLKSAEAQVALDEAGVNQYAALAQFKAVTAPFDGVITDRNIDIGNLVTAGSSSTTTSLYVITQNDPMRVFVDVPQSAAADLMQGHTPVSIRTSDGATRAYTGNVTRTAGAINSQARTLRVEVDIPNAARALVPGMYVKVAFTLTPKGLVQVPAAALLFRTSGPQVALVDRTGHVRFHDVTIARDDGSVVELGSGVAPGDHLALNLSSQIGANDVVKVNAVDAAAPAPTLTAAEH